MRIGVIPGDGIGPEVTAEAFKVLEEVARSDGFTYETVRFDLGAGRYLKDGFLLDEGVLDELSRCDAALLGAVGDPRVPPGVVEVGLLLRLRQELDLYINLRPARVFPGVPSAWADRFGDEGHDLLVVRENSEGLYAGDGEVTGDVATEVSINTSWKVERLIRFAFGEARRLGRCLTLVHKTNVLQRAGSMYAATFDRVSNDFPDVSTAYQHVDAACLLLVTDPSRFQMIVTDNLFGDIISDLAAGLVGGIGLVGSGNVHPGKTSLFEPVHGSAPDIAGSGRANPIGAILSAAMLLRHVGHETSALRIESAVARVAAKSAGLPTAHVGDLVGDAL